MQLTGHHTAWFNCGDVLFLVQPTIYRLEKEDAVVYLYRGFIALVNTRKAAGSRYEFRQIK